MKRKLSLLLVFGLILVAGSLAMAQDNPFVGTWKLNVAASKFDPGPAPQSQTRTWDAAGAVSITGVNAAGKSVAYGYTITGNGKPYPTSGAIPNGADKVSSKKANPNTIKAT